MYILLIFAIPCLIAMIFFLPESLHSNILHRRAIRLGRLPEVQGKVRLITQHELDHSHLSFGAMMKKSFWTPFGVLLEPVPMFLGIYVGFVYALFYVSASLQPRATCLRWCGRLKIQCFAVVLFTQPAIL